MTSWIFFVSFAILLPKGISLKCFSCNTEQCYLEPSDKYIGDQRKYDVECPAGNYMCGRAIYTMNGKTHYYRGCIPAPQCTAAEYCRTVNKPSNQTNQPSNVTTALPTWTPAQKTNCIVDCCSWDMCNSGRIRGTKSCYTCTNEHEYASCSTETAVCSPSDNLCIKVKSNGVYFKSCSNDAVCAAFKKRCGSGGSSKDCNAYCCTGNLCNYAGSVKSLLTITVIFSLVNTALNFIM